ncbi:MAG: DUF1257 domain-containing protein [Candidatus Sericytochromatia bacterium]|nr:DUF1257 domain-containing protein [Candidatus Sericytochromatia bacterium]
MSHFTRVKTRMTDANVLCEALRDLGYKPELGGAVRGYAGQAAAAEMVLNPGGAYDIGFARAADGTLNVVADWWGVSQETGMREDAFLPPVLQRYAYRTVLAQAAVQGFQVVQEVVGADRGIRLTIRRWT